MTTDDRQQLAEALVDHLYLLSALVAELDAERTAHEMGQLLKAGRQTATATLRAALDGIDLAELRRQAANLEDWL